MEVDALLTNVGLLLQLPGDLPDIRVHVKITAVLSHAIDLKNNGCM